MDQFLSYIISLRFLSVMGLLLAGPYFLTPDLPSLIAPLLDESTSLEENRIYLPLVRRSKLRQRVNAIYFEGAIKPTQAAIFWFGYVNSWDNYADVRVGYNESELLLRVQVTDRRLWYDPSPFDSEFVAWDAISLFIDLRGGEGFRPHTDAYKFVGQLTWWEPHQDWQSGYRGNGASWVEDDVIFTASSTWRGNEPNDDIDDRGWVMTFQIPFSSLGLLGPPEPGSKWGMGMVLHDRDDAIGTPIEDKNWPISMEVNQPENWGELSFGLPEYVPPPVTLSGKTTIRNKFNGAVVPDAAVGGHTVCGGSFAPDYFTGWGDANYGGYDLVNVQNQTDIADWPCYSKYYLTFPLDTLPKDKQIISATARLTQWGNAGMGWENPSPQPSLIQVLTVREDWDEYSITWNNAPQAWENLDLVWAYPLDLYPYPGIPRDFDVSRAVAAAYAAGRPLMLAVYSADGPYHSGRFFHSSDAIDYYGVGRPTLIIEWGE